MREAAETWNREAPLLARLRKTSRGGAAVFWTLVNGGITTGTFNESDDVVEAENTYDDRKMLSLLRSGKRAAFRLSHDAIASTISSDPNVTADALVNLFGFEYLGHLAQLGRDIELALAMGTGSTTSVSTGSPAQDIVGLVTALQSTTYAGQTVSANKGLQAVINTGTGTLTKKQIDGDLAQLKVNAGGITPNWIMTTPITAAHAFLPLVDQNVRNVSQNGGNPPYNLGTSSNPTNWIVQYTVNGIPVIENSAWSIPTAAFPTGLDGYYVMGRDEDLEVDVLNYGMIGNPLPDASTEEQAQLVQGAGALGGTYNLQKLGIPALTYSLGKTGSSIRFAMETKLQLVIKRMNTFALRSGITTS